MHLVFIAVVVIFVTSCASSEEHLVPKHGIEPKHFVRKRDLSPADAELILKLLLAKLEHGVEETELLHKNVGNDKEHYLHGSDFVDKAHLSSVKEDAKYLGEGKPLEHEDAYKKEMYYGTQEQTHLSEKMHLSEGAAMKGATGKIFEPEMYPDKVSDKDVSLAESLYHMKIAGDVETYPDIKMASLSEMYGKNMAEDKLHLEESHSIHKMNSDETFMKKFDDIGKTILKEEDYPHIKDDNIQEYLKKIEAEEKSLYPKEKVPYPENVFNLEKTSEEKALDEWKASHKDVFAAEETVLDGKFKLEGAYEAEEGIDHEMNDELMKKFKSLGINKEMNDELLHMSKELHYAEGGIAHEMSDEFVNKLKSFGIDKEKVTELLHLFRELNSEEGGFKHEMSEEFMKKLKSLGIDKEISTELLHLAKESYLAEGTVAAHEKDELFIKKLKSLGIDKEMVAELLHLAKESHRAEEGIPHEMQDLFIQKLKSLGIDKEMGAELLHLAKESHLAEGGIAHEMDDMFIKNLKSLGIDKEMGDELLHLAKESYLKEEGITHEMGDAFIKKLKSLGIDKEMGAELLHLAKESHLTEGSIAHEMSDAFVKKLKSLGIDKEIGAELLQLSKGLHPSEGDITHEMSDVFIKKLKSFGIEKEMGTELLHLAKESHLAEGSIDQEMSDAFVKKLKSLGIDKEIGAELLHLSKGFHPAEGDIAYEMGDELMKKLKVLGIDKKMSAELLYLFKELQHSEGSVAHEISDEFIKKLKTLGIEKEMATEILHLPKELHHAEGSVAHELNDQLIKNLKTLGMDKEIGTGYDELLHSSKDFINSEGSIAHGMTDEMMKKVRSLGLDKELGSKRDEHLRFSKEFQKEEGVAEGSIAYEKALEQARKDAHVHLSEEEMKKHMDESLKYGAKDVHGTRFFQKGLTGEKERGIDTKMDAGIEKALHGIISEESMKSKEVHGLDEAFAFEKEKGIYGGKIAFDDEVKHSKAHEIPFAFGDGKAFKDHEDEILKKDITYGTDALFHKDKEILKASEHYIPNMFKDEATVAVHDEHHGVEKGHTAFHDLKTKFFQLLTRVLQTRKCHLVTMRPSELLSIVNCVSKSKDPLLCEKFSMCEKKMPLRVLRAKEKCQRETIPGGMKRCTRYAPLFPSPETPLKLFQCVALNVRELMPEEKKMMTDFEECARALKAESCVRFKWFRGPH